MHVFAETAVLLALHVPRITPYRLSHQVEYALDEVEMIGVLLTDESPDLILSLTFRELGELVWKGGILQVRKALILSELLRIQADIYAEAGNQETAYASRVAAFCLLAEPFVYFGKDIPDLYRNKAQALVQAIETWGFPIELREKQMRYYEALGAYQQAEQVMLEDIQSKDSDAVESILHFYDRLLRKSDRQLAAADLTRDQIKSSITALRRQMTA